MTESTMQCEVARYAKIKTKRHANLGASTAVKLNEESHNPGKQAHYLQVQSNSGPTVNRKGQHNLSATAGTAQHQQQYYHAASTHRMPSYKSHNTQDTIPANSPAAGPIKCIRPRAYNKGQHNLSATSGPAQHQQQYQHAASTHSMPSHKSHNMQGTTPAKKLTSCRSN